jgi:iron complex outermembrane receptor protein
MNPKTKYFIVIQFILFFFIQDRLVCQQQAEDEITTDTSAFSVVASPFTVYASKLNNPFVVSSIDQRQIQLLTEPIIEPLLNATPGLWMQSGALNTNRISIRGVGYREPFATTGIKIYLDEIPLTNGVGESSIEDIHPNILSGIDIWRGPSSALWGSGLGGMIHLKSHIPDEDGFHTKLQIGSYNRLQFDQHVSSRYGKKDQWGTAFHYQYINDDGYRDNNEYRKNSVSWIQQWRGEKGLTIHTLVHAIGLEAFIPSSITLDDYENNPSIAAPTWDAVMGHEENTKWITGVNATYAATKGWVYKGSVFGTFFNADEVRPFNVLEEKNISTGMRHRVSFNIKETAHITAGFEYFKEDYIFSTYETLEGGIAGMQLSENSESRSYLNTFVQTEWHIKEKWIVFAGLNMALSSLANDQLESSIPMDLFPTTSINYAIDKNMTLSTTISRGYSSLSLDDMLNADGMINQDIVPETGWSEEVSFKYSTGKRFFTQITLFNMNIKNTVLTRRIMDDVFEKLNGGSSIHQGVELEYRWMPIMEKIYLQGAYTFGNFIFNEFEESGLDYSGNQLPGSPMHRVNSRLKISPWRKWDFNIDHQFVSDVYLNDSNSILADGYQLLNAGLLYKFMASPKWNGSVSVNVHNVLDIDYSPMFQINAPGMQPRYYYPGKPRSFYLNLALTHKI